MTTTTPHSTLSAGAWLTDLHQRGLEWLARQPVMAPTARTREYADLTFAYALARVGHADAAREIVARVGPVLSALDDAHVCLFEVYRHRIEEAEKGAAPGVLPAPLLEHLEHLDRLLRYIVDRLRKDSTILGPERINPYRWGASTNPFEQRLEGLCGAHDAAAFEEALRSLRALARTREHDERISAAILEHPAPARGPLVEAIQHVLVVARDVREGKPPARGEQTALLRAAIRVSATASAELFRAFPPVVLHWLRTIPPDELGLLDGPLSELVVGFLVANLPEEADPFLNEAHGLLLEGQPPLGEWADLLPQWKGWRHWPSASMGRLRLLLRLAQGWYAFRWDRLADAVLVTARTVLFGDKAPQVERASLGIVTVEAVRFATQRVADQHFQLLFSSLSPIRDTYTTASHFSVAHLLVLESIALAATEVARRPD